MNIVKELVNLFQGLRIFHLTLLALFVFTFVLERVWIRNVEENPAPGHAFLFQANYGDMRIPNREFLHPIIAKEVQVGTSHQVLTGMKAEDEGEGAGTGKDQAGLESGKNKMLMKSSKAEKADQMFRKVFVNGGTMKKYLLEFMTPVEDTEQTQEALERNRMLLQYHNAIASSLKMNKDVADIIGCGLKKCGTTWIQFLLMWHPLLKSAPIIRKIPNDPSKEWYRSPPKVSKYEKLSGHIHGYGSFLNGSCAEEKLPFGKFDNATAWIILCEPAKRAFSDFVYTMNMGNKASSLPATFDELIKVNFVKVKQEITASDQSYNELNAVVARLHEENISNSFITKGMEYLHIQRLFTLIPHERVCIINGGEMLKKPGEAFEKMQDCLGIPKLVLAEDFVRNPQTGFFCLRPTVVYESRLYKLPLQCMRSALKGETRSPTSKYIPSNNSMQALREFYRPYDENLFRLIGKRLWST